MITQSSECPIWGGKQQIEDVFRPTSVSINVPHRFLIILYALADLFSGQQSTRNFQTGKALCRPAFWLLPSQLSSAVNGCSMGFMQTKCRKQQY